MAGTATNHWKLGLFVVVTVATLVAGVFWLGARRLHREAFPVVSYFDESVQGLDVGSPVKFRGVTLGTVTDITVAPDHRHVQVTADIYVDALARLGLGDGKAPKPGDRFIDPNLRVRLASAGITGVRFLQTDFVDPKKFPPPELPFPPPWNYVPSAESTLKSLEVSVTEILDRFPALEEQAGVVLADLRKTLSSFDDLAGNLRDDDGPFQKLLVRLSSAANRLEVAVTDAELSATTKSLRGASGSVGTAADSVGSAASGIGDARDELRDSLVALRETLDAVRALADSLERDPSRLLRGVPGDAPVPTRRP
jgi:phospholipid/cholesterol/gamma-HCH transport system substrate-binding protein